MAELQIHELFNSSTVIDYRTWIVSNPDGSYTRHVNFPSVPSSPDPNSSSSHVLSKDISVNITKKTCLRVYLPRHLLDSSSTAAQRSLPLLVFYQGGGFMFGNAGLKGAHDFCIFMSQRIEAVIVSVEFRCAPEHRLPAVYEDTFEALQVIKSSKDDWLTRFADISSCFLMGISSGANIAYQTGLRVCRSSQELEPLKVKGLVLLAPYFGGLERTGSESKMVNDTLLPLDGNDYLWELSLPVGSDRDHEYCNPKARINLSSKLIREAGAQVLLFSSYGDPLIDRHVEFAKMLEENGVMIVAHIGEGCHVVEVMDSRKGESMCSILKDFSLPQCIQIRVRVRYKRNLSMI
ncbi:alpha/beta-Hydrolases superfamily protein [Euphorbia peplus]|nr:alpha/beta-Hydrolases superfamily protein [Euphorbia peplus]